MKTLIKNGKVIDPSQKIEKKDEYFDRWKIN